MTTSNLQILRTLIAKDWRLFRVPMIALMICGIGAYLLATLAIVDDARERSGYPHDHLMPALQTLCSASVGAVVLTGFLACALGGIAIAGERMERSSDFIGLLPVTRGQLISSKLLASGLILSLFTAFHLLVGGVCMLIHGRLHGGSSTPGGIPLAPLVQGAVWWIGITICLFGVGWMCSTFLASGPISVCISIAVTAAAMVLVAMLMDGHRTFEWAPEVISGGVGLMIGLPSLIGGIAYYLQRTAP